MNNGNGVKVWQMLSTVLGSVLMVAGTNWAMIEVHGSNPHRDAVPRLELDARLAAVEAELSSIHRELTLLREGLRDR